MNANTHSHLSKESIAKQLHEDSGKFIELIIKERWYLLPRASAADFWQNFRDVVNSKDFLNDEIVYAHCAFLSKMNLFHDLYWIYQDNIQTQFELLQSLNPGKGILLKALTLVLEIGDVFEQPDITPGYSFKSLKSFKSIIREYDPNKHRESESRYSLDLYNCVKQLIALKIDLETLLDFIGAYESAEFDLTQLEDGKGYELRQLESVPKMANQYVIERVKAEIKQNYRKREAHEGISREEHFKAIDPTFKTDKGFAAIAVSGATLVSQPDGTTDLKLDENIFDKMNSNDPATQQKGFIESLFAFREQHFHYNYRHAMAEAYYPNDILNIHDYIIKTPRGKQVTLYDVFCATSCLVAVADNFRYFSQFPGHRGIVDTIPAIIETIKSVKPDIAEVELKKEIVDVIATHFESVEANTVPFIFLSRKEIITQLRVIKELNNKSDEELGALIEIIVSAKNSMAYNPLYKVGDEYLFHYKACLQPNFNRMVYDYFISQNLFRNGTKSNKHDLDKSNDKFREEEFCKAISRCLKKITVSSVSNLKFPKANEQFYTGHSGDFDGLSYFEKENCFLAIQVKLSNTYKKNENGKAIWVEDNIWNIAATQIEKDRQFLKSPNGLKFASKKLRLKSVPQNAQIFHLVITDNFYADHRIVAQSDRSAKALCISFFEFYNLFFNNRINSRQQEWENVVDKGSIKYFLQLISKNVFWKFLEEVVDEFRFSDQLKLINKQNSVRLTI